MKILLFRNLPVSFDLSYFWNLGSLLGKILVIQVASGFLLVFYYSNFSLNSFDSVQYLMFEVNEGWFFRLLHFNFVSLFFIAGFLHFLKGFFYSSYRLKGVWVFGLGILILLMLVSFLGYVMVWSQMSFWAGIVITSLLSVVPIFGGDLTLFFWGAYVFSGNSLKFFFALHFLLPFFLVFLVVVHLYFLHFYSSSSSLFFFSFFVKKSFFPFFWFKDLLNVFLVFFYFSFFLGFPFFFSDFLMFEEINFLVSPVHIVPEWYFLFAYAILRSFSSKSLGVFLLIFSLLIFLVFVLNSSKKGLNDLSNKVLVILFVMSWFFLTWIGGAMLEFPFLILGGFFSFFYFFLISMVFFNSLLSDLFF
uniref:Cytochrome b n=2 Tax=Globodera rostochiensis TaxID=31243 RepID=A0A5K7U730_GLORO|nr:cytochrome b [Globodera rostochiensis]